MFKTLLQLFGRENKGAPIIEYVIILAMSAIVIATFSQPVRDLGKNFFETVGNLINEEDQTAATTPTPSDNINEQLMVSIQMTPEENITDNTPISFSASVTGGEGPYTYNWTNYVGNEDGSLGSSVLYPSGLNKISLEVVDNKGVRKSIDKTFVVQVIPASITISDTTPKVGDIVNVKINTVAGANCRFLTPFASTDCEININIVDNVAIDLVAESCLGTECQLLNGTISPSYNNLQAVLVASLPSPILTTEFVQFRADVTGGSGDYTLTWTNYDGPTNANLFGEPAQYPAGTEIIQVNVCDNQTLECDLIGIQRDFEDEVSEDVPLMTWLERSITTIEQGQSVTITPKGLGGLAPYTIGTTTQTSGGSFSGSLTGLNSFDDIGTYTFDITICDAINTCQLHELEVEVVSELDIGIDPPPDAI
jgi:Flp pilus assembly pilin Flp